MNVVYLGILSTVFNWVFEKILEPVFSWVADLLSSVLSWLFNSVLAPLLQAVFWPLFQSLVDLIMTILAEMIYQVFASVLKLIDALQAMFNIFSGLTNVKMNGQEMSLLQAVFQLPTVRNAFWVIFLIGFALTLLLSIFAVMHSTIEFGIDMKRPVSRVLTMTMKAMFRLLIVPVSVLFLIQLSTVILGGINTAMNGTETSLSRTIFVVASLDAAKDASYNISTNSGSTGSQGVEIGINDKIRGPYYNMNQSGAKDYQNITQVKKDFDLAKFDYLIGFAASAFIVIILAMCMMIFITRIFDVMILYLISPFFISMMPIDDGEKFRSWQDMFVAKLFGGYGCVIMMQLYMIICPAVLGSQISFGEGTVEAQYLLKLLFLLGGAWAVYKGGPTVTQLLSAQAGMSERETAAAGASAAIAAGGAAVATASLAYKGGKSAISKITAHNKKEAEKTEKRRQENLGFGADGESGSGQAYTGGDGSSGGAGGNRHSGLPGAEGSIPSSGSGGASSLSGSSGDSSGSTGSSGSSSSGASAPAAKQQEPCFSALKGRIGFQRDLKTGQLRLGLNFGKKFLVSKGDNKDGSYRFSFMGFGYKRDASGKITKWTVPFMNLKKEQDGTTRVSKVRFGSMSWKREEVKSRDPKTGEIKSSFGGMYMRKGLFTEKKYDQETGKVETLRNFTERYGKNAAGEYVKTSSSLLGLWNREYSYRKTADGQTERFTSRSRYAAGLFGVDRRMNHQSGKVELTRVRAFGIDLFKQHKNKDNTPKE